MPLSKPWKGVGSALFLELGKLVPPTDPRLRLSRGEASISLNWYWRLENVNAVIVGSSDPGPKIEQEITVLKGQLITAIRVEGRLPELTI